MTWNLSDICATYEDSNILNNNDQSTHTKKHNRTLKTKPSFRVDNLKKVNNGSNKTMSNKNDASLSEDIYLEDSEHDELLPPPKISQKNDEEVDENQYKLLGMGNEENDYAEEKYNKYLNKYKQPEPLLAQSNDTQEDNSYAVQYPLRYQQVQPNKPAQETDKQNETLLKKLNYMIHLLEEQKHEQTNNVTEELILYIFLGIFIIFVVDSFTRVGKYKR